MHCLVGPPQSDQFLAVRSTVCPAFWQVSRHDVLSASRDLALTGAVAHEVSDC